MRAEDTPGALAVGAAAASNASSLRRFTGTAPTPTCLKAHALKPAECAKAKAEKGRVFNTAYCKHGRKFRSPSAQQDLCDAFCFTDWVEQALNATEPAKQFVKARRDVSWRSTVREPGGGGASSAAEAALGSVPDYDGGASATEYLCMTSAECNWTNQPTLYRRDWYLAAIAAPCEKARPNHCIAPPGRRSAVLQELFFSKFPVHWAHRRYKVCVPRIGLFYHHEVDNREPGDVK